MFCYVICNVIQHYMLCNVSARLKNAQTTIETYISYRENRLVMPPRLAVIHFFNFI
jgi:hypothetical protein